MSAEKLNVSSTCAGCGAVLTIEEMHYYDNGNGKASCNACEGAWSAAVSDWRQGIRDDFPASPTGDEYAI